MDASPAQQSVVMGLIQLPFALKLFCGFLSDSTPIFGLRRKPYFLIGKFLVSFSSIILSPSWLLGWLIFILSYLSLAIIQQPNIVELALFIFIGGMGFIQADVCTDAMIVERSKKYETISTRGFLQATGDCNSCFRFDVLFV